MSDISPKGAANKPSSQPSPEPVSDRPRPPVPTDQADRNPSMDTAKDILGELLKRPADIPVPEDPPSDYDRMAEIAKANSSRVQAFSGGLPDDWEPVVADEPDMTEVTEPSITGDTE